jgi:hypothetical protein
MAEPAVVIPLALITFSCLFHDTMPKESNG